VARRALVAALLIAAASCAAAEDSLGTLFLTAAERARLDSLRRGETAQGSAGTITEAGAHTLTGYVQRSDGRAVVWIDGRALSVPARNAPRLDPRLVEDSAGGEPAVRMQRHPAH
jgi:hypothetical protein